MLLLTAAVTVMMTSHVRTTDPLLAKALRDGLERSATIRRLVDTLDRSDVIVYLARGECPRPALACVMMAGRSAETRYARINFRQPDRPGKARTWTRNELSVLLAHELQHAVEIAGWPEVVDAASLEAAYRQRGGGHGAFHLDTEAAVTAGDARREEIARRRR